MKKRGQVFLYTIIGITLVLIIILSTYIYKKNTNTTPQLEQFATIEKTIHQCLDNIAAKSILLTGAQGGYYNPDDYENYLNYKIPYYKKNGNIIIPDENKIQTEITLYLEENIKNCIKQYDEEGIQIETNKPQITTKIKKTQTIIKIQPKIILKKDGNSYSIKDYEKITPIEYSKILNLAKTITNQKNISPGLISSIAEENKIEYMLTTLKNNTIMYEIKSTDIKINEKEYTHIFLIKYE